jgi:hypothetical protein
MALSPLSLSSGPVVVVPVVCGPRRSAAIGPCGVARGCRPATVVRTCHTVAVGHSGGERRIATEAVATVPTRHSTGHWSHSHYHTSQPPSPTVLGSIAARHSGCDLRQPSQTAVSRVSDSVCARTVPFFDRLHSVRVPTRDGFNARGRPAPRPRRRRPRRRMRGPGGRAMRGPDGPDVRSEAPRRSDRTRPPTRGYILFLIPGDPTPHRAGGEERALRSKFTTTHRTNVTFTRLLQCTKFFRF